MIRYECLSSYHETVPPTLHDMKSCTNNRTGHARLRSFTDPDGNFWLEHNRAKWSKWVTFAKKGHDVAWEFSPSGGYSGRMLIGGEIYTATEAVRNICSTGLKDFQSKEYNILN